MLIDIVQIGSLFNFKLFLIVSIIKFCFCKRHYHVKGNETCVAIFKHNFHTREQEPTTAPDRQIRRLGLAFEHSNDPIFKSSNARALPGGGGC